MCALLFEDPADNFVRPKVLDRGDGTYVVTYLPADVGRYTIVVQYSKQDVPNSPFYVVTMSTGYPNKVKIIGRPTPESLSESLTLIVRHVLAKFMYETDYLLFLMGKDSICEKYSE